MYGDLEIMRVANLWRDLRRSELECNYHGLFTA